MNEDEDATSGPWRIEAGTAITPDGASEIVGVFHEKNAPIYVERDELPDLIGALMLYLDIKQIEAK
jgi:hypothetical protein